MAQEMDLDGFLGHTTSGPSTMFLQNWKSRENAQVRIVLHTKAKITAVWVHNWPKIVTRQKEGVEVREAWSVPFNSWENAETLSKQFKRMENGEREHPPEICPMSIMLEMVYQKWKAGELEWDTELFRFVGDDESKAKSLHVASMLGQGQKVWDELDDAERKAASKRGIPSPKESWKENMQAKCLYMFTVVDYDNPKDGIQIARETTLVGDKMKKVIRDRMNGEGDEIGHPYRNPYVFQWEHHPEAKQFQDKYQVIPVGKLKITDAIRKLVIDTPAPDIRRHAAKGNISELRASMEDAYVGPEGVLDFDEIFAKAEEKEREEAAKAALEDGYIDDDISHAVAGKDDEEESEPEPVPAKQLAGRRRKAAPAPIEDPKYVIARKQKQPDGSEIYYAADGVPLNACDVCQTIIRADEPECRSCGEQYEVDPDYLPASEDDLNPEPEPDSEDEIEDEPEPEPPPPPPKAVRKAPSSPQKAAPAKAATRPTPAQAAPSRAPQTPSPKPSPKPAGVHGNRVNGQAGQPTSAEKSAKGTGRDRLGF